MVDVGQRVRVHVNLHKQRLSVADPSTGKVIDYVDSITLTDVTFRTQRACLDKIKATGVRAVCAYAVGHIAAVNAAPDSTARVITFNPHRSDDFHYADTHEPVTHAGQVTFADLRAYEEAP